MTFTLLFINFDIKDGFLLYTIILSGNHNYGRVIDMSLKEIIDIYHKFLIRNKRCVVYL
jgi:hypothetical protein